MREKIYYIDPQSYSNLAVYDYSLIERIREYEIIFWGSELYNYKTYSGRFIPIFRYNKKKNLLSKSFSYFFSLCSILKAILKEKPHAIHIQWIRIWAIDLFFLLILKALSVKVIFTAHNIVPHNSGSIYKVLFQVYYKIVDYIVVHVNSSKLELQDLFQINNNKIYVIPHGILDFSLNEKKVYEYVQKLTKQINLKNKIVFSIIGTQTFYKGSDLVAAMWLQNSFLHDKDKYQLIIAGRNRGADFSELEKIENVWIDDSYISDEQFQAYQIISSIILMPYRKISQSGVLLSIIKNRIPFIVTRIGGLEEVLTIADVGWAIDNASVDSMSTCIQSICKCPQSIERKKDNKFEWSKLDNYYNWDRSAELTCRLYSEILNGE